MRLPNSKTPPDRMDARSPEFEIQFISDSFAVRDALIKSKKAWIRWNMPLDLVDTAVQVLAEVLNNVVEHAHSLRPDGAVIVKSLQVADSLRIEVLDNGAPMPDGVLAPTTIWQQDVCLDDLPEGGFGWFMIQSMAQDLHYERQGDWNRLQFSILEAA